MGSEIARTLLQPKKPASALCAYAEHTPAAKIPLKPLYKIFNSHPLQKTRKTVCGFLEMHVTSDRLGVASRPAIFRKNSQNNSISLFKIQI